MPAATTPKPRTQAKLNFGPARKDGKSPSTKPKQPANGNILKFFKKVETEETMFYDESTTSVAAKVEEEDLYDVEDVKDERYNEILGPSKRRRLSHDDNAETEKPAEGALSKPPASEIPVSSVQSRPKPKKGKGPFLEESDGETDDLVDPPTPPQVPSITETKPASDVLESDTASINRVAPVLKQEDSVYEQFQNLDELDQFFGDEEFEDGEEYRERRYMEEQARLEAEEAGNYTSDGMAEDTPMDDSMTASCPICSSSLAGITPDQATIHVNACLDGNPIPLPSPVKPSAPINVEMADVGKRFSKAALPRPGQSNPICLGETANKPTSAFSKLMSGHAEDAAWASAAAAEHASRGKPAYQRTCPFYKIMPGFFICVDAFRYGAVEGCNAYFLSHFHSDHYVGLTANWSHGPIYCSKVTGDLVKQQLRTDSKWVVHLEFEETVEIPGTQGVTVTMIPANHCPGSSLFLFEKVMGKGPTPRTQRILHCGDFRACTAQVAHPLLRPDTLDAISGKTRQQKIDICYLDTTYLNPRYSFPSQNDVIRACADFCVSISGDPMAADEAYDALHREKGTANVSKFFTKESDPARDVEKGELTESTASSKNRLLVICGTYSIGKERICKAIALALKTKIFASAAKIRICQKLGDPELAALMTSNPLEAQVHMQMLMEIRAETLQEYLNGFKPHFSRIVGFRPSGWNFRAPGSTAKAVSAAAAASPTAVPMTQILHGGLWRTRFGARDFVAQRGSTREAMCFGVPYSEHSSFRELALFVMSLRIEKVVPTVNVGSEASRKRMKGWTDRWISERRKGGLVRPLEEEDGADDGEPQQPVKGKSKNDQGQWDGKDGKGGTVLW